MAGENRRSAELGTCSDPVAERLRAADTSLTRFARDFAQWYWSLMSGEI
jgi:hypothetical protein